MTEFKASRPSGSGGDSDLLQDVRWSLRSIVRHPAFSLGVIGVLGLGLGANAAVFAVVDGTLRGTSWWAEPDAAVAIWPEYKFSAGQLTFYSDEQSVYGALGGYSELAFAMRAPDGESESVNGVLITPELFRELAVQPTYGRALADDDALLGVEPVVVIGEGLWRRSLNADPGILGSTLDLGGTTVRVVGIQGDGAAAPGGRAELWMPFVMDPREDDFWKARTLTMVGVLRPGGRLPDAFEDLTRFTGRLTQLFPAFFPPGFADGLANVTAADAAERRLISTPLILLLVGTGILLLVTALNVGNLLLGRSIERRKELAVRSALGAGRGRIVRQLAVEGLVLTMFALALGLLTGSLSAEWLAGLFVGQAVVTRSAIMSPNVLGFALALSVAACVVLNGVPIAHFLRAHRSGLLLAPSSGSSLQKALVAVQASLATVLLVSATLLTATVGNLRRVPLGFDASGLLTIELSPPEDRIESVGRARRLYDPLVERVSALPGVQAAGLTGWLPLRVEAPQTVINLQASPVHPAEATKAPMQVVDPGFFNAMGVQPLAGRLLNDSDRADNPSAVVVNQTLADALWPDGSAVGQMIAIDPHAWSEWLPVVGVVPDIKAGAITDPAGPTLYVALAEFPARDITLLVRTVGPTDRLLPAIRQIIREVDPLVPIRGVAGMDDVVRAAYSTAWVLMGLLIALATLATGLGAIGIYAVLTHYVAAHRRVIGVRMALGAQPRAMVVTLVKSAMILAGVGILAGSAAAAVLTRFLDSLLFGITSLAPLAYIAPAMALCLAAGLAAWVPAARAARLPPAEVLRSD